MMKNDARRSNMVHVQSFVLFIAGLAVCGCSLTKVAAAEPPGKPLVPFVATGAVATVNGTQITAETYNERIGKMANMIRSLSAQAVSEFSERLVSELVDAYLIEAAVTKKGYTASDAEVREEYDRFVKKFPSPGDLKRFQERTGFTEADIKRDIKRAVALKKLLQKEYGASIPSEKEEKEVMGEAMKKFLTEERGASRIEIHTDAIKINPNYRDAKGQPIPSASSPRRHNAKCLKEEKHLHKACAGSADRCGHVRGLVQKNACISKCMSEKITAECSCAHDHGQW
jgi:hypothetical protein